MKILVIRFSSAGDILLASPFLRALRRRFPEAEIDMLTKDRFRELIEGSPSISRVITLEAGTSFSDLLTLRRNLRREGYDFVFDLHNSLRSRIVRFGLGDRRSVFRKPTFRKWLLVRFKINLLRPIVPVPERYLRVGESVGLENDGRGLDFFPGDATSPVRDDLPRPIIALAPGARHFTKRWPAEKFGELGRRLLDEFGGSLVLLGGPDEVGICGEVEKLIAAEHHVLNLSGRTTFPEAACALEQSSLLVTNDSALAHLGAACSVPVVTIFGSTVEEFGFVPYTEDGIVVQNPGLPCRPCTTIGRAECPLGHFRCMNDIEVDDVLEAVHRVHKG